MSYLRLSYRYDIYRVHRSALESMTMSTTLWIFIGALIWFVAAAAVGPAEQERQSRIPDPY